MQGSPLLCVMQVLPLAARIQRGATNVNASLALWPFQTISRSVKVIFLFTTPHVKIFDPGCQKVIE